MHMVWTALTSTGSWVNCGLLDPASAFSSQPTCGDDFKTPMPSHIPAHEDDSTAPTPSPTLVPFVCEAKFLGLCLPWTPATTADAFGPVRNGGIAALMPSARKDSSAVPMTGSSPSRIGTALASAGSWVDRGLLDPKPARTTPRMSNFLAARSGCHGFARDAPSVATVPPHDSVHKDHSAEQP